MATSTLFKCPVILLILFASALLHIGQTEEPTFTQCRVHIEAAIKGIATDGSEQESPILQEDQPAHIEEQSVESVAEPPPLEEEHDQESPQPEVAEEHVPEESQEVEAPQEEEAPQEAHPVEEAVQEPAAEPESEPEPAPEEEVIEEPVPEELPEAAALVEEEAAPVEEPVVEEPIPEPEPEPEQEAEPVVEEEPVVIEEPVAVVEEQVAAVEEPVAAPESEPEPVVEVVQEAEPAPVEEAAPVIVEDPAEGSIEEAPEERRSRDHISRILRLGQDAETDMMRESVVLNVLKDVKKLVENSVRSLETIFKYNDVSNRNFGDPEIFSKPLVLFLGPWSGGKSSIINYLLGTEFTQNALKTGAEPSATFFQILMYGEVEEMLDGTQLAADWTFSGLQKFGQAFIDRLRGKRLPNKILEKCNIVEVPGILEVRKQVDRPYPFNDVVQWFIDRADIIFVVYDPTKLDTGLEHEALFDQLKGRQNQVRVLLNKADSVTQEELLLIQNNLVWNLSPLMASPLPPTLYAGSFWSKPYKPDAPVRLLRSHEENMLQDLRDTLDNVVENTIAEARRHAVRVRNHAKMVDCYLTTFFNQKGFFGNKKATADDIIENPHAYHIFEGLSTLSNISRYDLPDAEVYKDFFRLHALYDFKPLASTCTFFRGCPLDKLDTAIAYELPELVGKYKKRLQSIAAKKTGR